MSGGGGSTTNVTNTGLGDEQYAGIMAGGDKIFNEVVGVNPKLDNIYNQNVTTQGRIGELRTDLAGRIAEVGGNVNQIGSNLVEGFVDPATGKITKVYDEFSNLNNRIGTVDTRLGNVDTRLGDLNTATTTGFTNVGDQLTEGFSGVNEGVRTGFANVGNQVTTGFEGTAQNIVDARDAITRGMTANQDTTNARFDEQGNMITTGFEDARDQLTETQTNVLGGQGQIRSLVEQYGDNLTKYYADLSRGQEDAATRLGGLQTGLDQFRDNYGRDALVATQQRAKLTDSVAGGFNAVRDDLGRGLNTVAEQNQALAADVRSVNEGVAQGNQQNNQQFSDIARKISLNAVSNTQQDFASRNEFVSRLNAIKQLVVNPAIPVPDEVRADYMELASSFDDVGRLISRSAGQDGLTTARALDSRGDLLLAKFDNIGNRVDQRSLNVDTMLRQLDELGIPANTGGIASPFIVT
jgi:uncharacterized phage infection (PIP) family protein YhgE